MFECIYPLSDKYGRTATVVLGDGTTKRPVEGWGYARYKLHRIPIRRKELYIPDLGTHLTSITQHYKYQGCYFHAENNTALLAFPSAVLQVNSTNELTLPITPSHPSDTLIFDQETAALSDDPATSYHAIQLTSQPMCNFVSDNALTTSPSTPAPHVLPPSAIRDLPQHQVLIKPLTDNVIIPTKDTPGSAGFDVYNPSPQLLPPHTITKIPLQFSLSFDN